MSMTTCRFCKEVSFGRVEMVKYGVRHYACFKCYLEAGKSLDDLSDWQVGRFPYRLLEAHGQLDYAKARLVTAKV